MQLGVNLRSSVHQLDRRNTAKTSWIKQWAMLRNTHPNYLLVWRMHRLPCASLANAVCTSWLTFSAQTSSTLLRISLWINNSISTVWKSNTGFGSP
jgi:hypothetical protein